jgi:DNA topoisomerase IB
MTSLADGLTEMPGTADLRPSDPNEPGIRRMRHGRGFIYLRASCRPVKDQATLRRIKALAVPPAWTDVWICASADGHLQAVGTDAAGRRQYRYHPVWREQRDRAKFDHVLSVAERLPDFRERVSRDLKPHELTRERVLAAAARMLDPARPGDRVRRARRRHRPGRPGHPRPGRGGRDRPAHPGARVFREMTLREALG